MGVNILKVKSLFESRTKQSNGRSRFVMEMRQNLGLCDEKGNDHKDAAGNATIGKRTVTPEQFSVRELAEAILGPAWSIFFDDSKRHILSRMNQARAIMESAGDKTALLESTGYGLDPTAFLNINTFTALVGGLVEVKILESFKNPDFISDQIAPAEPTKLNGQKIIGIQSLGDFARKRLPGNPTTRAQFGERWVTTPETRENALAVDVLKETVFFDLTGDILRMANDVGEALGYRKELEVLSLFIGGTNNFNYNGQAYNTYQTSKTLGYTNDFSNPMVDWTSLQTARLQFMRTEDPHTGKRILINPDTIVVNPAKIATAEMIVSATQMERRTGAGASPAQTTSNPLNVAQGADNPYRGQFKVLSSPLLEQMCLETAANGGLALAQNVADEYWWMLQGNKAFKYMQNYPMQVLQAAPQQYEMMDKGIVASYFASERGIPAVISPWHIIRNKN